METQKLILTEDVYDALFDVKCCTIRKGRRDIQLGNLVFESSEKKRTIIVNVESVIYTTLEKIPKEYYENDGFISLFDMLHQMRRFYPDLQMNSECTVVVFS